MKKYIRTAKGTALTAMTTGVGAAVIGGMGGSTAGLNTMSAMMPAAIGAEMGGNIIGSFAKLGRRSRRRRKR